MTDVLTTRDGLIGNSPRYTGHTSPPYQRYLKDDAGNAINLTGVSPSALSIVFVNQSNPLWVKAGSGTFSIPSGTASQGLASYQYGSADLADAGNWYAFWAVQLTGEPSPRAFDPDFLSIIASPSASGGGSISVTVQDVNLTEVNGTAVSSSNPVPTSGPVTAVDGGIVALGTTTDTSSASTTIGLLKAIKAYLGGTLTASVNSLPALPAGTNVIGHVVVDSAGAVTVTSLPSLPAGTNVIGHVIVDSAGSVSITSLPSLPAGSNTIGGVKLIDSAGTNVAGVDSSNNQLVKVNAALPSGTNVIGHVVVDSAGSVSVTSLPALPAGTNVIGHVIVDSGTITANAGTNLNTSLLALESGGNLASIKSDADSIKTYTSAFADGSTSGSVTNDNDVVSIALPGGQATALIQITGTFSGTLNFEVSADSGSTYNAIQASLLGSNPTTIATSTTTTGIWRANVSGFTNFRVKLHPVVSGSASIIIRLSQGVHNVTVNNSTILGQNAKANSTSVTIASDQSSYTSPLTTEASIISAIRAGKGFVATTGSKTSGGSIVDALSLFNTHNSGKTLLLYRVQAQYGTTAGNHPVLTATYQTSDPGPGWTSTVQVTPQNASLGGAASVASVYQTAVASGASIAGSTLFAYDLGSSAPQDILAQGQLFILNDTTGFTLYINTANTTTYALNFFWIEI